MEWESSTIRRVMRSALACEAASSSVAFDRVSFLRAIIAELWGLKGPWYERALHVPACLVTDCRSLHDHLLKNRRKCV